MHKRFALVLPFMLVVLPAGADDGLSLAAGVWDYSTDEDIRSETGGVFNGDLRLDDGDDAFYELTLRPPSEFVPVFGLRYMNLDVTGDSDTSVLGGPLPLPGGGTSSQQDVDSDIDDLELLSYYRFRLPAGFGLDIGASVKRLDGEIVARDADSGQEVDRREIDVVFPLVLGAIRYRPVDWLDARVSARGISAGDDSASEYRAEVGLRPWSWLTVSGGYWRKHYDVEDNNLTLDLTLSGPFVAVSAGF